MAVDHGDFPITWAAIRREITRLAKMTLQNASIGRAGLRVYGGGWISIINGGLRVVGSAIVEGLLEVTGNLTGSGPFLWTGPWELRGDGQITGNVDVTKDIRVLTGGKIQVGDMVIDPSAGAGRITFANGMQLRAGAGGVTITNGTTAVNVGATSVDMTVGGSTVQVNSAGIWMENVPGISVPGAIPDTLMLSPNGQIIKAN